MQHCGWNDVIVTGDKGDGGGDVVGVRIENGQRKVFVVQVKAVQPTNYVGPDAIQEAIDALPIYSGDVAVVATNGTFTKSAEQRKKELEKSGFRVELWNGLFLSGLLNRWPEYPSNRRPLRKYQSEIVEKAIQAVDHGERRIQFVVATGLGKSVIGAEILNNLWSRGLRRMLVLCHSQDLAMQLEQSFWGQIRRSVPTRVFFGGKIPLPAERIDFGLFQSLGNNIAGIDPKDYEVILVDEAHHALAQGFRSTLKHCSPDVLIGMTATPWRGDGAAIDEVFGKPISKVSLIDGMKMGFLARVDYRIYADTINWKSLIQEANGKISIQQLNRKIFIPQRDDAMLDAVALQLRDIERPRAIFFCATIEHADRIAAMISARHMLKCKNISGLHWRDRARALLEFAAGKVQALCAVDVLNEGIDVPETNLLVFMRTTHSRRIFVQQLGRGLRLAEGKEMVKVLDFVSDVRRLGDVMELDEEARSKSGTHKDAYVVNLSEGIVKFEEQGAREFAQQWITDVADLGDSSETRVLHFPELS